MAALLSNIVAMSTAFSPGHVTGIFAPADSKQTDILTKGSVGAGFSISSGITTTAKTIEATTKGYVSQLTVFRFKKRLFHRML